MDKKEFRIGFLTAHYTSLVPVTSASFNGGDVITWPNFPNSSRENLSLQFTQTEKRLRIKKVMYSRLTLVKNFL